MMAVSQQKADHNLPLTFYFITLAFNRSFERGLNVDLLLVSAAVATIIRFEFLNKSFLKWLSYLELALLIGVIWNLLQVIFGPQMALQI